MLVNTGSLLTYAHVYVPALLIILIIKFVSGFAPVLAWGYPRIATEAGAAIAQVGEFSLVLLLVSRSLGLIDDVAYQVFTIIAVLSMLVNPFLIGAAPRFFGLLHRLPMPRSVREGRLATKEVSDDLANLRDHVLIAGYGLNGRNLARALESLDIPYAAAELGPEAVAAAYAAGEKVYYGDCTRPDVLRRLGIERARVFVVAISDPQATRRAVQVARQESATVHIIVRTRYVFEIEHLLAIGANEVIPEEFETSLEILARTLHEYQVPTRTVDQAILRFRSDAYQALRQSAPLSENRSILEGLSLALEIETVRIRATDFATGKTLRDLALPSKTRVVILAIRKGDEVITTPAADYAVADGDMLILVGTHEQLVNALDLLEKGQANGEGLAATQEGTSDPSDEPMAEREGDEGDQKDA
ncbi:MAG: NAD-binding protein [Polyangiaceae bacterium]|nr:NAD-binding protein [Polyangiaceae bacterium]